MERESFCWEERGPNRRLFQISVNLSVPLETPYPWVPAQGDVGKGTVWETLGVSDLNRKMVKRSMKRDI